MPEHASPREILGRLIDGISNGEWHQLADLYAEQATIDYPFAIPAPRRLEGREAIRRYFAAIANMPLDLHAHNVVLHETSDPEVVVAEYDYEGHIATTGHSFQVSNIQVTRVRDGQMVASRDYHDHVALADATGQLPEMMAALRDKESAQRADPGTG
jgi:uncharacterized protein